MTWSNTEKTISMLSRKTNVTVKSAKKKIDLVEIEWLDHCTCDPWTDIQGVEKVFKPVSVITVGYLLKEMKDCIYIASTIDMYNKNSCQTFCIIKSCITKRKVLKKVEFTY